MSKTMRQINYNVIKRRKVKSKLDCLKARDYLKEEGFKIPNRLKTIANTKKSHKRYTSALEECKVS